MKTKLLAALLLIWTAAAAQAGTMTFSGIVTDVQIDEGSIPGYYSWVQTKVGDAFSGRVDWSADRSHFSARIFVGPDGYFPMDYPQQYGWFNLSEDARSFDFYQIPIWGWGGTDGGVGLSGSDFFASVSTLGVFNEDAHVFVQGTLTKQTVNLVPETGATLPLFASALGVLFGFFKLHRGGARA